MSPRGKKALAASREKNLIDKAKLYYSRAKPRAVGEVDYEAKYQG